jgi:hypothetical protein
MAHGVMDRVMRRAMDGMTGRVMEGVGGCVVMRRMGPGMGARSEMRAVAPRAGEMGAAHVTAMSAAHPGSGEMGARASVLLGFCRQGRRGDEACERKGYNQAVHRQCSYGSTVKLSKSNIVP